jgi:hypothetical protein
MHSSWVQRLISHASHSEVNRQQPSIRSGSQAPAPSQTPVFFSQVLGVGTEQLVPVSATYSHPAAGSQESAVHALPSLQSTGAGSTGQPFSSQSPVSSMVHLFPSSQSVAHTLLQGPATSPCARWAASAFSLMTIVWKFAGFPGGMWQTSTFEAGAADTGTASKVVAAINTHAASATGGMGRRHKDGASRWGV